MIAVRCLACSAKIKAPDEAAGKTSKCPKCGEPIQIPRPPLVVAADSREVVEAARAITNTIHTVKTTFWVIFWLIAVFVLFVFSVFIYVAILRQYHSSVGL